MVRDYGFIIPREIDDFFRRAMIPEFPSLFKNNPGDVFQDSYSCDDFTVQVLFPNDTELLGEADLSIKDLKYIDSRFQHAIGNWLMDKKARGDDEIAGKLDKLAKDIYGQRKVRSNDYRILLINLKSLSALNYDVYFKEANKEKELAFRLIENLEYDEDKRSFIAFLGENIIGENLVPHVVNDDGEGPESIYTTKSPNDLYPKQDRYEFNMRQYLATIKNNKKTIIKTGGDYLLNQFGYRSHYEQFNQKYRNKDAERLICTYKKISQEYGITIQCLKGTESLKKVRDRFYSTHFSKNTDNATVPKSEMDAFVIELARFIKNTGEKTYQNEKMYTSKAREFIRKHGFNEVKSVYDGELSNMVGEFTFKDLTVLIKTPS